jgi:hypothetical protein
MAHNLATGEVVVRADDVPAEGLETNWTITAKVPLRAVGPEVEVTKRTTTEGTYYFAHFGLHIPQEGESQTRRIGVSVLEESPELRVVIFVSGAKRYQYDGSRFHRHELFRELSVVLPSSGAGLKRQEEVFVHLREAGLETPHETQTPPGVTQLTIRPPFVYVRAEADNDQRNSDLPWNAAEAVIAGPIEDARSAALRLWTAHQDHFDAIDDGPYDLALANYRYPGSWLDMPDQSSLEARSRWTEIVKGDALRDLADAGYRLGLELFPPENDLRQWLCSRRPGHLLDCSWSQASQGGISHVPWGLVYLPDLPSLGEPVDPLGFLGLRFRLRYSKRPLAGRRSLGKLEQSSDPVAARLGFFWGSTDPAAEEVVWQRSRWHDWPGFRFVPTEGAAKDPKAEVHSYLMQPGDTERVLYLYCHGSADTLRFGDDSSQEGKFSLAELPTRPFADPPFIFLNACGSVGGDDPLRVHEIERRFTLRRCRAYLGTEIKIPIRFASRFADTFFHFFTRRHDERPMSAGEALAQTRLFYWSYFKNPGGLFYSLVDESEIFLATPEEVSSLRSPH